MWASVQHDDDGVGDDDDWASYQHYGDGDGDYGDHQVMQPSLTNLTSGHFTEQPWFHLVR